MKTFKNKSVLQKILIALMIVVTLGVSIPKPVQAAGGILLSPIVALVSTLLDVVQRTLEWTMLGEYNDFMKDSGDTSTYDPIDSDSSVATKRVKESDLDGTLWGWDAVNVPDINYTPEEIFSNRVPALDINFLNPSVTTGNEETDQKMNVAVKLQPVISSWYIAIRTLAVVGLLSVLVYLGIRMILSGVAADKAKYKKMLMDWVVAMCLVFALHYIMSLALTGAEVITSMIASKDSGSVNVEVVNGSGGVLYSFSANLMSYVRFMMQSKDTMQGITFLALYLMLIIYNVRFTWTYLKRVVNMAFLTLISPIVALTYPIDKVSDGKAQAFDMWIKEFVFNALLQPLHLLLYIVLLGSATELAIDNPLYAIVALGFIFAGEKLLKQMFNFSKAGGGTVGSLAGAVGVSNLASQALMGLAKGPGGKGGAGNGKVRTSDQTQRDGKNTGANKGYDSFDKATNQGIGALASVNDENTQQDTRDAGGHDSDSPQLSDAGMERRDQLIAEGFTPDDPEWKAAENELGESFNGINTRNETRAAEPVGNSQVREAMEELGPEEPQKPEEQKKPETWRTLRDRDRQEAYERKKEKRIEKAQAKTQRRLDKQSGELSRKRKIAAYKTFRGIKGALPAVARKTLKTASRGLAAGVIGATAGVIGATTGDAEKALGMAATAFGVGAATGDDMFNAVAGRLGSNDVSLRDAYKAGKYGNAIDARNEEADKAYLKSEEHKEEYEKYFKQGSFKMSKKEFDEATKSYREVGITNKKDIRKALRLEKQYRDKGGNLEDVRGKVQNIVQTYDGVDKRAVYGNDKATEAALKNIESQLSNVADAKQRRAVANEILQGYRDWYNVG